MKKTNYIQSIERAFKILRCFENHEVLGVTELSKMVKLHKSTVFNIVATLEHERILVKVEGGSRYKLGVELFRLGTSVDASLRKVAYPYLEKLSKMFLETVNLVGRNGNNIIYIEKFESPSSMLINTEGGKMLPLYCTAAGKAIMSQLDEEALESALSNETYIKFTAHTRSDRDSVIHDLDEGRRKGYWEDLEEFENGLVCVSVPIKVNNVVVAAISVSGPVGRMTPERRAEIGQALNNFSVEIARKMSY